MKRVCIIGASGKLGQYMVQQALDRGYQVVGDCRLSDTLGACYRNGKLEFDKTFFSKVEILLLTSVNKSIYPVNRTHLELLTALR